MTVPEGFAYRIPDVFSDSEAAPLLCAGAIGYWSLRLTNLKDGQNLGLTGFGASAHLVLKMALYLYPKAKVFVFARSEKERTFAKELGAVWAGDTEEKSPEKLDCIIDTTPVWKTIVEALKNLEPGGRLVINAIRKEEMDKEYLLRLDYPTHLWLEKDCL
jgi:propanol-preferring alcohol dehydrogenase